MSEERSEPKKTKPWELKLTAESMKAMKNDLSFGEIWLLMLLCQRARRKAYCSAKDIVNDDLRLACGYADNSKSSVADGLATLERNGWIFRLMVTGKMEQDAKPQLIRLGIVMLRRPDGHNPVATNPDEFDKAARSLQEEFLAKNPSGSILDFNPEIRPIRPSRKPKTQPVNPHPPRPSTDSPLSRQPTALPLGCKIPMQGN